MNRWFIAALLSLGFCGTAWAQNEFPTPTAGKTATGVVSMCLNGSNQAVPVSSGTCAGGSSTIGAVTQGSPAAADAAHAWSVQGAGVAGTPAGGVASVQGVSGGTPAATSVADGADTAEGSTTSTAATVGSTGSLSAKLRLVTSQLDAITTALGNGIGTPGSAFPAQAAGVEGRTATTDPTAVTDGQGVAPQLTKTGRTVTAPYSIPELMVRGMATATNNAATTIIASAGGSLKNYITGVQCYNTSATTITVTFSDSASTQIIVPAGGGNDLPLVTPLVTAAATAFTFTASTGETTIGCSAQGYTGL